MKHITFWLKKKVISKIYEKSHIRFLTPPEHSDTIEKFIDENRKRIQDLELVVQELVKATEG
tara:strand:- start:1028 stop:1213 length:186 start_codon:yes stop_codon:yes gene_type:complete